MKTKALFCTLLMSMFSGQLALGSEPFCVAHRSQGFGGLENSLEAFKLASKARAKAIEFDLVHTKDGKTIVYHDEKFDRLASGVQCPKNTKIKELTFLEIQNNCKLINGEAIPTFEEVLNVLSKSDSTLFIEFKDDKLTESDLLLIKSFYLHRSEKIVIISFFNSLLYLIEKKKATDDFLKPIKTIMVKKYAWFTSIDDVGGIDAKYIHKLQVKKLQDQGKLVGVYTKDSEEEINDSLDMGVNFITTNNSALCAALIKSRQR